MKALRPALVALFVGSGLLAGCSSSLGDMGDGTDEDALSLAGCSAHPSCTDVSDDGQYCKPICSPDCQVEHVSTAFWVSPYEVAGSYGLGRHQGAAILSIGYGFDPRQPSSSRTQIASFPSDMSDAMMGAKGTAHDHGAATVCGAPQVLVDQALGNHGRSLSRAPIDQKSRTALGFFAADAPAKVYADPTATVAAGGAWMGRAKSCLARIKNGFCDAVCGNCSYVLPTEGLMTSRADDWSRPDSIVEGSGTCSEPSYYGGPGQLSNPTFTNALLPNPFTHCARLGCSTADEAPSLKSLTGSADEAPMSGLYGHNSNTDAEAEFLMFNACMNGTDGLAQACAACGGGISGKQSPCDAHVNTAATVWNRTASTSLD